MRTYGGALRRAAAASTAALALVAVVAAPSAARGSSTPAAPVTTCALLGQGAAGGAVRTIQRLVGATVDGQFGPATAQAIRDWQGAAGIPATGVMDAATWAAMPAAAAQRACAQKVRGTGVTIGCAKLAQGASGVAVAVLQRALEVSADGEFAASTVAALEQEQRTAGLEVTGMTSRASWKALHLVGTPVCTRHSATPALPKDYQAQQQVRAQVQDLAAKLLARRGGTHNKVALAALSFAQHQIGKPYVYGGTGPSGYDCSGLVMASYLQAGLTLPRVAAAQYAGAGPTVPLDEARAGDLLFYASDVTKPATVYHVAMYAGGGQVLDAPHTGANVGSRSLWTTDLLPQVVRPVAALTLPLRAGATGWTVTQLQQALNRHGAALSVDGGYGPETKQAVQGWQAAHDLRANGVVRLATWLTLGG